MKLSSINIIFMKELKDILRDKRAVFISIIIPICLFPLIFSAMNVNLKRASDKVTNNLAISITGKSRLLHNYLKMQKNIAIRFFENPQKALYNGDIYLIISLPERCDERIMKSQAVTILILTDNTRQSSLMALNIITKYLQAYHKTLPGKNTDFQNRQISIVQQSLEPPDTGNSKLTLSILLPLILMIFAATSPLAVATDLGAGEKERGTLEPLLASPPSRINILLGKLTAITLLGILGVIAFILGIVLSFWLNHDFFGSTPLIFTLTKLSVIIIMIFTLMLIVIFGAIELAVSIFARSPKEAQVFFIPILMISLACGYGATFVDPKNIDPVYRHIPLINISLLIKELTLNIISIKHILLTFTWSLIYAIMAFFISLKMFFSENVLFRSS